MGDIWHTSRVVGAPVAGLTAMFQAMPSQSNPRFLHCNAMFLASLVSSIKLSAVEVFESGNGNSKAVNAGIVFFR